MIEGYRSGEQMRALVQSGHWRCLCGELVRKDDGPTLSAFTSDGVEVVMLGGHEACVESFLADLRAAL